MTRKAKRFRGRTANAMTAVGVIRVISFGILPSYKIFAPYPNLGKNLDLVLYNLGKNLDLVLCVIIDKLKFKHKYIQI